ncbi:hypoxanthine phosphoribosyltransferase [candidate division WOR-3 bacterium]|uniref:Hypoxanthine phosphoribosyltransferase n=1 Tax=candidate division WOR-3 bacterium TaxID=2052148 RepID=A0A660SF11_UNCW3|nr:MAG: hypoxanthine phosphoribosyltransferase [candidate division WOR-3 bacterium]
MEILISESMLRSRINELIDEIGQDYGGSEIVVIGILTGSFVFLADLVRGFHRHNLSPKIDFMTVSSYGKGKRSSGRVRIIQDVSVNITGCEILIVDDILDTGRTLHTVVDHLKKRGPKSVRTCVLLDKKRKREVEFKADYIGFEIPDCYVVGYGLDYNGRFRELPFIGRIA